MGKTVGGTRVRTYERDTVRMSWAARTDVGKLRRLNEDSLVAEPGLYAVADGMGGHAAGDVASRLVVEHLQSLSDRVPLAIESVGELVGVANATVREHAQSAGTTGMGTTLVAAMLVDNAGAESIVVVNVGDSRCYVTDADGFRILTRDHSLVQELVDAGRISADEARHHPEKNVVTRAIGADDHVVPDYIVLPPAPRQRLLLCSDGVSGQVDERYLEEVLGRISDPGAAVDAIIARVLEGRAPDNATAIVLDAEWTDVVDLEVTDPRLVLDDAEITGPRPTVVVPAVPPLVGEPPATGAAGDLITTVPADLAASPTPDEPDPARPPISEVPC